MNIMNKDNLFYIFFFLIFLVSNSCQKTKNSSLTKEKTTVRHKISKLSKKDSLELIKLANNPSVENHMHAMHLVFGAPKHTIKSIGILVYNGVNSLDVFGPRYILGQAMGAKTELIAIKSGNIKTIQGIEIVPNTIIDSVKHLDILIIPGGFRRTIEASYNKQLHKWIRQIDKNTIYTGAVCTGGWILGATGLLKDKKASTNWYKEKEILEKYGAIPANERYTKDGKYWTSAGVTAGMDMCLAILQEIYGDRYAQGVMLDLEYDASPPLEGGSPEKTDWSVNWMMKTMYDIGINPIIDSLETKKK